MSKPFPLTLRVLAHLLSYPDTSLRDHLAEMTTALQGERALRPDRLAELSALMQHLRGARAMDVEAHYVETFDRGRGTALHLFEHVHGDSRDRGPAMIDLLQTYEQAGLYLAPGELPDHLTVVLEYASTQPPAQARMRRHVQAEHLARDAAPFAHQGGPVPAPHLDVVRQAYDKINDFRTFYRFVYLIRHREVGSDKLVCVINFFRMAANQEDIIGISFQRFGQRLSDTATGA